jgi:hypothetical protein
MSIPEGPRVRLAGNGIVRLQAWERRVDGWWAVYAWPEVTTEAEYGKPVISFPERSAPADQVEQLLGEDYSQVPRRHQT